MRNMYAYDGRFQLQAWKQWLIKNVKNMRKKCEENVKKMRKKNRKNAKKCDEHIWKSTWEGGTLISFSSGLIFLPNFCRLKIGEEQFKSIGSGLCRSQIC